MHGDTILAVPVEVAISRDLEFVVVSVDQLAVGLNDAEVKLLIQQLGGALEILRQGRVDARAELN